MSIIRWEGTLEEACKTQKVQNEAKRSFRISGDLRRLEAKQAHESQKLQNEANKSLRISITLEGMKPNRAYQTQKVQNEANNTFRISVVVPISLALASRRRRGTLRRPISKSSLRVRNQASAKSRCLPERPERIAFVTPATSLPAAYDHRRPAFALGQLSVAAASRRRSVSAFPAAKRR